MSRPERYTRVSPEIANIELLKGKLSDEVASLEHELKGLRGGYTHTDLSLSHTYREMIRGRRELLQRISLN